MEATLVVCSETPRAVAARVSELSEIAGHPVAWSGTEELRDVYLEVGDGDLRAEGLALRLRRGEEGRVLTLKGEGRPAPGGGVERTEVEVPWSADGLERVLGELEARGVRPVGEVPALAGRPPVEALEAAGFRVLQDRRTLRRAGRILPSGEGGDAVGWLAVDTVGFRTASERPVRHREVEVEAAPTSRSGLPGRLARWLRERFGRDLRPWRHSKLATGLAVAELAPPVGPDGDLLPAAYDLLEEELDDDARAP